MLAAMLTRWAVCPKSAVSQMKVARLKLLLMAPINPGLNPELDWPILMEIIFSQKNAEELTSTSFQCTDEGWVHEERGTWIPTDDNLLKLRIIIAAHTQQGGTEVSKLRWHQSSRISGGKTSVRMSLLSSSRVYFVSRLPPGQQCCVL